MNADEKSRIGELTLRSKELTFKHQLIPKKALDLQVKYINGI